ncbi:hypothetical protein AB1Y20_021074 [Prymnesium parvum]|uniref:Uncharacterized protein n=1 Tax=Prymnesium parvum TaxID=97485 RepID=A0AB34JKI7_PRYPA
MGNEQSTQATNRVEAWSSQLQSALGTQEVVFENVEHATSPTKRETAGAATPSSLLLFGGHGELPEDNELWSLRSAPKAQWERVETGVAGGLVRTPCARSGHSAVWADGVGLVVFGGLSHEKGRYLSDAHLLRQDEGRYSWSPISASGVDLPCARDKHSAVVLQQRAEGELTSPCMLVFGGFGVMPKEEESEDDSGEEEGEHKGGEEPSDKGPSVEMGWFDDSYALDCESWRWSKVATSQSERPSPRAAHGCCSLPSDGGAQRMVVIGGRTTTGRSNDTWVLEYDGKGNGVWQQPQIAGNPPCRRSFHSCTAIVTDASHPVVCVFGGLDASANHLNDLHLLCVPLWEWVPIVHSATAPSPRGSALLCRKPSSSSGHSLLLFGGSAGWSDLGATDFFNDTYEVSLDGVLDAIDTALTAAEPTPAAGGTESSEGGASGETSSAKRAKREMEVDEA